MIVHVTRIYSYVTCMLLVCDSCVFGMYSYVARSTRVVFLSNTSILIADTQCIRSVSSDVRIYNYHFREIRTFFRGVKGLN